MPIYNFGILYQQVYSWGHQLLLSLNKSILLLVDMLNP